MLKSLKPKKSSRTPAGLGWLNRLLGAGLTMGIATLILGVALGLISYIPSPELQAELRGSRFQCASARTLTAILNRIPQKDRDDLKAAVDRWWQRAIEKTGEKAGEATRGLTEKLNKLEREEHARAGGKTERRPGEAEKESK
jgi:hypothetical protein